MSRESKETFKYFNLLVSDGDYMDILMRKHALEQSRERGISINEIKETINKGAKFLQDDKIVSVYRHIKVVFKKINNVFFVITVMIRKEKNGK